MTERREIDSLAAIIGFLILCERAKCILFPGDITKLLDAYMADLEAIDSPQGRSMFTVCKKTREEK